MCKLYYLWLRQYAIYKWYLNAINFKKKKIIKAKKKNENEVILCPGTLNIIKRIQFIYNMNIK